MKMLTKYFVLSSVTIGLLASTQARALDEPAPTAITPVAQERLLRLPALKVGGIRSGEIVLITERGVVATPPMVLVQQQMPKQSPQLNICNFH